MLIRADLTILAALALAGLAASAPSVPNHSAPPPADTRPARALEQDPPPDDRDEIEALVDQLGDHAKQRGKEDQEAIAVMDVLVQEFPASGPKDRAAIVKALDKCLREKRPEQEGGRQNQLFLAAATALGEMTPESVDVLLSWIDHKTHRRDLALQRVLILKAGGSKTEKAQEDIVKLLKHHEAQIQAAAAEALGNYGEADEKLRKETFEALLKTLMDVKGQKDSDPTDIIARERWDVIAAPIITSLQMLSGHDERDPQEWQHWWNKNKREDWSA